MNLENCFFNWQKFQVINSFFFQKKKICDEEVLEMDHWFHDFFQRSSNEVETWKWDSINSNFAIKVHTRISSIFWSPTDQWSWIMSKRCVSILLYLNFTIALKGKMLAYAWPSFSNSYIFFSKKGMTLCFSSMNSKTIPWKISFTDSNWNLFYFCFSATQEMYSNRWPSKRVQILLQLLIQRFGIDNFA